jgi:hypothetical protein
VKLPAEVWYTRREFCAPREKVHIPLNWEPKVSPEDLQLWVRYPGPGQKWERLKYSTVQCESCSGVLRIKILAVVRHGKFPYQHTDCDLILPATGNDLNIAVDNSTSAEGNAVSIGGRSYLTINGLGENQWKEERCSLTWQPALTPIFCLSSDYPSGGELSGSAALLRRGAETASIRCGRWHEVERGFFLLEPPGGSATNHWQGRGPILTGSQPHEGLAIAMTRELAVGRLHVHDDPNGAHWPLGWRIEEVAPGVTLNELKRQLNERDPAVRDNANRICKLGRLDMSRRHSILTWDPERGLQGDPQKPPDTACSITPLERDPLLGPWELSLIWGGRYRATLQIHRETVRLETLCGDYSLDWFWATQSKPEGLPELEDRIFVWFPWEWQSELSPEQLKGVDRSAFWGRIGQTPFLWALDKDGKLAFYDEDELPKEIRKGGSHD